MGERVFALTSDVIGYDYAESSFIASSVNQSTIIRRNVPDEQPIIIQYEGAIDTKRIEARYAGGLGYNFQAPNGFSEEIGLQLIASEPYWYGLGDEKVDLAPNECDRARGRCPSTWNLERIGATRRFRKLFTS